MPILSALSGVGSLDGIITEPWFQHQSQALDLLLLPSASEKEMTTHSSILAWEIPWMEEAGRLQSMGSQRVATERLHFNLCERESKIRLGSFFLFFSSLVVGRKMTF